MDWKNETVLEFIKLLHDEPCIWDYKSKDRYNKCLLYEAWDRLSNKFSVPCSINELKRKRNCLLTQYRDYKRKRKEYEQAGVVYKPTWFAFDALDSYLADLYDYQPKISEDPMELLIVEESEQTESNHGVGPHFAKFRESTQERPLESPIPHELNTPLSRESSSRKRTESNADPLSDSISTCKRQRRLQNSTVASKHTEEDFTHNKDRSNEAAASAAVESDLYGQLLAQKLKPLDVEDRLVLMNDIDNLVFKHLMDITKRNKMFRSAELQSTIQGHSDNRQFTDLSGSYSRLNQIQNESQNVMQNSQHEMPFMVLKTEAE